MPGPSNGFSPDFGAQMSNLMSQEQNQNMSWDPNSMQLGNKLNMDTTWGKIGGMDGLGDIAGMVGSGFNIYTALKSLGLAKDQHALQKESYQTNMRNSVDTANTNYADKINSQYRTEGKSQSQADQHIAANALSA